MSIDKNYYIGFLSVAITAILSNKYTMANVKSDWYNCIKPSFTPPNYVFPIVWTILYILVAFAFTKVLQKNNPIPIILFYINLILNVLWCYFFFHKKNVKLGFRFITMLVVNTSLLIIRNKEIRPLLLPYLAWLIFAATLNYKSLEKQDSCKNF